MLLKKALVAAFYLLQGLGNLVFSLFLLRDPLAGNPPGIILLLGVPLFVSPILLLLTVLALILRSAHAAILAVFGSALSMGFYAIIASFGGNSLSRGQDGYAALWLMAPVGIIVLNIVALIILSSMVEKH